VPAPPRDLLGVPRVRSSAPCRAAAVAPAVTEMSPAWRVPLLPVAATRDCRGVAGSCATKVRARSCWRVCHPAAPPAAAGARPGSTPGTRRTDWRAVACT